MTETISHPTGFVFWTYKFRFDLPDGQTGEIVAPAGMQGIHSRLLIDGQEAASDYTPVRMTMDTDVTRNHLLDAQLATGQTMRVQLGYVTSLKMGIRVFLDGALIHESHPGKTLDAYEQQAKKARQQHAENPEAKKQLSDLAGQKRSSNATGLRLQSTLRLALSFSLLRNGRI